MGVVLFQQDPSISERSPVHEVDEFNKELGKLRDHGFIARAILQEGRSDELKATSIPFRYNREDMTPEAQAVLLLVLHNIKPKLHRSLHW